MQRLSIILLCVVSIWGSSVKEFSPNVIPFNKLNPRIINGEKAAEGQFPWQVSLFVKQFGNTWNLCGGAVISDSWILTAAHCVDGSTNITISLGSNILNSTDSNRVVFVTNQYVQHEDYNRLTLASDIAVIPLPEAVTLNNNIKPIVLADSLINVGTTVTVSGWGLTSDDMTDASPDLNYANLVTISDDDCAAAYGGFINPGVICAQGGGDVIQNTCEGDSGGPLVTDASENPVHVGIVSYGHNDGCESGSPAGFTRTDSYRDWIQDKTGV